MPTDLDVNGALSRPTWPHRTRAAVVAAAGLHLAVTTLLLQLGGSSARTAGVVWMLLASGAGAAWFAVDGTARSSTASLAVSGSQIARRVTWTTITDPHGGTVRRSGIVRLESGVTAVRWTPEGTEIDVARATTLTVASAPEIVFVPGDLRPVDEAAASLPPGWRRLPTPAAWPSGPTDGDRGDWRTDGSTIVVVREEGVP